MSNCTEDLVVKSIFEAAQFRLINRYHNNTKSIVKTLTSNAIKIFKLTKDERLVVNSFKHQMYQSNYSREYNDNKVLKLFNLKFAELKDNLVLRDLYDIAIKEYFNEKEGEWN